MAVVHVKLADLPGMLERDAKALKRRALDAIRVELQTTGVRYAQEEVDKSQPRPPVDRGTYRRGFSPSNVTMDENSVTIFNPVPYAAVVEFGRRPGTAPPSDVLAAWVMRKGITRDPREARSIAFAIGRKMRAQGWPFRPNQPMRVLERAVERLLPAIADVVKRVAVAER